MWVDDDVDPVWLLIALIFGFGAQRLRLPPLVGFLAAGFVLHLLGEQSGEFIETLSSLGVTLLLFTIGLKLRLRSLLAPEVFGTATIHMPLTTVLGIGLLMAVGIAGFAVAGALDWKVAAIAAFGLSFSSTVFAVKILEDRGESRARHYQVAIGILIIQDLIAVLFLMASKQSQPEVWAFGLLALPFARPLLHRWMEKSGHGEVLVLFGFAAAIMGGQLFDLVGLKAELGAIVFGILLAEHPKAVELSRSLLTFKDLFLVGFFLSIGIMGLPKWQDLAVLILLIVILLPLKMALFYYMLTRFRLRARTAFLSTLALGTYSEFALIVCAEGAKVGWITEEWLVLLAVAVAVSFVVASYLNAHAHDYFVRFEGLLSATESPDRLPGDERPDIGDATVVVMGMGRVGRGAYHALVTEHGSKVCGVEVDSDRAEQLRLNGVHAICGDAEDPDFWRSLPRDRVTLVMLALPTHEDMLLAIKLLKGLDYQGVIGAIAKHEDDRIELEKAGAHAAFNYYAEVGTGFADHVVRMIGE